MKKLLSALLCATSIVFVGCNEKDTNAPAATDVIEGNSSSSSESSSIEALKGVFSVSATKQVKFAKGNLQCKPSEKKWRFALNQYDIVGSNNTKASMSYSGWIDLFGWSTSASYYGVFYSEKETDYKGDFVDWGKAVGEGWFTLSVDEWRYLMEKRPNAATLYGIAFVANIMNGLVFLPDNWSMPEGLTFVSGKMESDKVPVPNKYTMEEWSAMEKAGAVFLPAAGMLEFDDSEEVEDVNYMGSYWTSTLYSDVAANYFVCEGGKDLGVDYESRASGMSVRLVMDAKQINSK